MEIFLFSFPLSASHIGLHWWTTLWFCTRYMQKQGETTRKYEALLTAIVAGNVKSGSDSRKGRETGEMETQANNFHTFHHRKL